MAWSMGSFTMRRDEYINLHGFAGIYYHHPTQSSSSYKVKDHKKHNVPRLLRTFTLSYKFFIIFDFASLLPALRLSSIPCPNPLRSPASSIRSSKKSTTISRNMVSYKFSSSDASVSTRHGSGPQSYGFGALVNFARHWNCCSCRNMNTVALTDGKCSSCGHDRCAACGNTYSA